MSEGEDEKSLTDRYVESLSPEALETRALSLTTAHPGLGLLARILDGEEVDDQEILDVQMSMGPGGRRKSKADSGGPEPKS